MSVQEFDRLRREESSRQGSPVSKMAALPLSTFADDPILLGPGYDPERMCVDVIYAALGPDALEVFVRSRSALARRERERIEAGGDVPDFRPIVTPTPNGLRKLIDDFSGRDDVLFRSASRMLALSLALPFSPCHMILTRALCLRYYAPLGADERYLEDWMAAFSCDPEALYYRLVADNDPSLLAPKVTSAFTRHVSKAMSSGAYASTAARIRSDSELESATSAFSVLEALALPERSTLTGELLEGRITDYGEGSVRFFTASREIRFKKGEWVTLRGHQREREIGVKISSLARTGDGFVIDLAPSRKRSRTNDYSFSDPELKFLNMAHASRIDVSLTSSLMSPFTPKFVTKRWFVESERQKKARVRPASFAALVS